MLTVSDPYFALPEKPPAEAGAFPFRVRGSVYQRDFACHRATLTPAQLAQAIRTLPDVSYERYLSRTFVATEMYDALPVEYMRASIARMRGVPFGRVVRDVMVYTHGNSLGGITGNLLKDARTETVVSWLTRVASSAYDFGRLDATAVGDHRVRCLRTGIPRIMVSAWSTAIAEFIRLALGHVGAERPRVEFFRPEPTGIDRGYEAFRISYEIEWVSGRT